MRNNSLITGGRHHNKPAPKIAAAADQTDGKKAHRERERRKEPEQQPLLGSHRQSTQTERRSKPNERAMSNELRRAVTSAGSEI